MKIRIGIMGYGNLGKGIECAVRQNDDMELVAIFTRREPETVKVLSGVPVYHVDKLLDMKDAIDVLMLCGGSATDLPKQTVEYAGYFNVVDSFDTHAYLNDLRYGNDTKESEQFRRRLDRYRERYLFPDGEPAVASEKEDPKA